jgi:excisionase family DNA binding protein
MNEVPITTKQRLFTLKQASEMLSFGVPTLRALIYKGELEVVRTSPRGKVRISATEIDSFIKRNTSRYSMRPGKR